ncbi:MAG: hypothetical protein HOP02_07550 [Methylococcaceae bacterium]|nr:hypothetical protein [Methylococcaceae bacterium]
MDKLRINGYLWAVLLFLGLWLWAFSALMIAPVWDEVNFLLTVNQFTGFWQGLGVIWLGNTLYRPLAISFLAGVLKLLPFDLAWPLLRTFNAAMVLASFWLIADAAKRYAASYVCRPEKPHPLCNNHNQFILCCYWLAVFLSPAALIVATWYPNIFDASCLLFIAIGIAVLGRGRWLSAGIAFGVAWFCKETAIFVLPLLTYLFFTHPHSRKITVNSLFVYIGISAIYWCLRNRVLVLGSTQDIHPFVFSQILPTLQVVAMRFSSPGITILPGIIGLLFTVVLALSTRKRVFFCFVLMLILGSTILYLGLPAGMLSKDTPLLNSAPFDARFFHIPLALLMFALLLNGRAWPFLLLTLSFGASIPFEFLHYQKFQLAYQSYFKLAAQKPGGIIIFLNKGQGVQEASGDFGHLKIGEYPQADYLLNPQNGDLTPTHGIDSR